MSDRNYKWCAWARKHDSHGPMLNEVAFLPDWDRPDHGTGEWVRLPWLDEAPHPERKGQ